MRSGLSFIIVSKPTSEAGAAIDAGHLLDYSEWTWLHRMVLVMAALAIVFDGFDNQVLSVAIPALVKEWSVQRAAFAPILASGLFAMALGTVAAGFLGDRLGRRKALIGSVLVFGAATLATALVSGLWSLGILRFVAGLGLGGAVPNATTISAEFTPLKRRALAVSMTIVCIPLGGALAGVVASRVLGTAGWQYLFATGGAAALVLAGVLAAAIPETPGFLVRRPERRAELIRLLARLGHIVPDGARFVDQVEAAKEKGRVMQTLFGGAMRRNTFSLWVCYFSCLFSVYVALNWLPTLLAGQGFNLAQTSSGLAAYNFGGIAGALLFGWLINFFGSKVSMLAGCAGAIASAAYLWLVPPAAAAGNPMPIVAITIHGLFANAVQSTMYALAAHIYPTRVRAGGMAAAVAIGRLGGVTSAFVGASLVQLGPSNYFGAIAVTLTITMIALAVVTDHIPKFGKAQQEFS